jgi:hypothetical protein
MSNMQLDKKAHLLIDCNDYASKGFGLNEVQSGYLTVAIFWDIVL